MKAYQYKITLKGFKPPVWRRIVIPANMSFEEFSDVIQELFGFDGFHLSEFTFPGMNVYMQELYDEEAWGRTPLVMGRHSLEEYEGMKKIGYRYDFGDNWEFDVVLEKIVEDYEYNYPTLLKYKGDNLVQDCGGIWGYQELLDAWKNPNEGNAELREWAGDQDDYEFDPEETKEILMEYTCEPDGTFHVKPGTDEELEVQEGGNGLPDFSGMGDLIRQLKDAIGEDVDQDSPGGILMNFLTKPDHVMELLDMERVPETMGETEMLVEFKIVNCLVDVTQNLSRNLRKPEEKILEAMELGEDLEDKVDTILKQEQEFAKFMF